MNRITVFVLALSTFSFLHADNWPDKHSFNQLRDKTGNTWGGFRQRINARQPVYRLIECGNRMRVQYRNLVYGDQAMFVTRTLYEQSGGFQPIPLMEDVCLSLELSKFSKPLLLRGPLYVDARRWLAKGPLRTTIHNWSLFNRFKKGAAPESLAAEYYGECESRPASDDRQHDIHSATESPMPKCVEELVNANE